MKLLIKKYIPEYRNKVVELLNTCFPNNKITNESFNWKHFPNHLGKSVIAYIGISGDRLCSFVCFTPVVIIKNNKRLKFYSCTIQATHPDFRRKGIVTTITKKIEKEIKKLDGYFGFSNSDGVKIDKYSQKINYQIVGRMRTNYYLSHPINTGLKTTKIKNEEVWASSFGLLFYEFNKDIEYLNWKFNDNPKVKYSFYKVTDKDKLVGYFVLRRRRFKYEIARIMVMNVNDMRKVFHQILDYSFRSGVLWVSFSCLPNNYWSNTLPFTPFSKNQEIYFTVKSKISSTLHPNNWLVQGGDIQ